MERKQLVPIVKQGGYVPVLQSKTATPSKLQQLISADEDYDGLSSVTVEAVTSAIDDNIVPENIKEDVEILGVTGTMKTPTGTISITENGTVDVTNYASASVLVADSGTATAKGLADGSLTSFSAPALGVTSLAPNRFRDFTNLQSLNLTGVTNIPNYTAYGCTGLTNLTIDPNMTNIGLYAFQNCNNNSLAIDLDMNGSVGDYAFQYAKLRSVKGTYSSIGSYAFSGGSYSVLDDIDIKVNGSISGYAFRSNSLVNSFRLDPTSNITTLGNSAFYEFGNRRSSPETNIFTFDFRNSTFTRIENATFYGGNYYKNKYMNIYFPSTMTAIDTYAFQYTDYCNMFYKNIPTLSNTNNFNNATNFKNLFPYNLVQTAKTSTNWSSSTNNIVSSIYGYAEENTFTQGQTLPLYDNDGYGLTWYDDVAMTNQVTVVSDPSQIYYCAVGSRVAVPLKITEINADVVVSDGINTYTNGVPYNTTITITATNHTGYPYLYQFTLNGSSITSGDTYTATSSDSLIEIVCAYSSSSTFDNIYGVSWVNDTSTTMTRTDNSIGLSYSIDTSTGEITSDFNNTFPWTETTIIEDSAGNKFLRFPDMYFRIGKDTYGDINSVAVSKTASPVGDWYLCKTFDCSIYGGSLNGNKLESKSGQSRLTSATRANFRAYAGNNTETGYIYHQLDLKHYNILLFLWWIEWATKDSASIMTGHITGSPSQSGSKVSTGGTDSLTTPSGYSTSTWQMRYHYIEDLVGNLVEWIDGISAGTPQRADYVTDNPAYFSDFTTNMTQLSWIDPLSNSYCILAYGMDNNKPFLVMPTKTTGTNNYTQAFSGELYNPNGGGTVVFISSHYNATTLEPGSIANNARMATSFTYVTVGGRLLRQPTSNFSS